MRTDLLPLVSLPQLRTALEASWDRRTAYLEVHQPANIALGQCYPTSRVVQWFFPKFEIVSGEVDTGTRIEAHFWNVDPAAEPAEHIDLTWQQFPQRSKILRFKPLDRLDLNDSPPTIARCQLLLNRVLMRLKEVGAIQ